MAVDHKDLTGNKLHTPFRWVFEDEADRLAASVTADDVNKVALQMGTEVTLWWLYSNSPVTWEQVGGVTIITTKGDLIIGDADGNPVRFPAGGDGVMLYYNDGTLTALAAPTEGQALLGTAGGLPGWGELPPGGDWEFVTSYDVGTLGSTSTVEFTDLDTDTYDYHIHFGGVVASTNSAVMLDAGYGATPTWAVGAWAINGESIDANNQLAVVATNATARSGAIGDITFVSGGASSTYYPVVFMSAIGTSGISATSDDRKNARFTQLDDVTALRARSNAGLFTAGKFVLRRRPRIGAA